MLKCILLFACLSLACGRSGFHAFANSPSGGLSSDQIPLGYMDALGLGGKIYTIYGKHKEPVGLFYMTLRESGLVNLGPGFYNVFNNIGQHTGYAEKIPYVYNNGSKEEYPEEWFLQYMTGNGFRVVKDVRGGDTVLVLDNLALFFEGQRTLGQFSNYKPLVFKGPHSSTGRPDKPISPVQFVRPT